MIRSLSIAGSKPFLKANHWFLGGIGSRKLACNVSFDNGDAVDVDYVDYH